MTEENTNLCVICQVDEPVLFCLSSERHGLCEECLDGYAKVNFERMKNYEQELKSRDGSATSMPGELPCPLFLDDEARCSCKALSETVLRRLLSDEAFGMWRKADVRIGIRNDTLEGDKAQALEEGQSFPLMTLQRHVQEALTRGGCVRCPECATEGEKDDRCMHIQCSECRTLWCYCCGRERGDEQGLCCQSNGCDHRSPYLENNPGWNGFAIGDETAARGALNEFHRRRMICLLRRLKEGTDERLWRDLQLNCPDMLMDVPTVGRRIEWNEIDEATPPLFGLTQADQVVWIEDVSEGDNNVIVEQNDRDRRRRRRWRTTRMHFVSRLQGRSKTILMVLIFLTTMLSIIAAAMKESQKSRSWLTFVACVCASVLLFEIVHQAIEARASYIRSRQDEDDDEIEPLVCAEVIFCGSRNEVPYLASGGRYATHKLVNLFMLSMFICFGLGFTIMSNTLLTKDAGRGVGPFLLTLSLLGLFLTVLAYNASPSAGGHEQNRRYGIICKFCILALMISTSICLLVNFHEGSGPAEIIFGPVMFCFSTGYFSGELLGRFLAQREFDLYENDVSHQPILLCTVLVSLMVLSELRKGEGPISLGWSLILPFILFLIYVSIYLLIRQIYDMIAHR